MGRKTLGIVCLFVACWVPCWAGSALPGAVPAAPAALAVLDDPSPPATTVRLIFIHHSTGGHWLADPNGNSPYGGLGRALMNNNYYVSATNYGWGPDGIGDRTDIINWPEWFTWENRDAIMAAVYTEGGQNVGGFGAWPRLASAPAGENTIVLFKSCFPNSDLYGNPNDPPLSEPNDEYSVANAKAVYNAILTYFATRQDKLFVVITAPPLMEGDTAPERAANARAFNNWLVNDWLDGYGHSNVAVYDYYNVLTSNGGDPDTNDLNAPGGNHHRWWMGAVQHQQDVANNYAAYPSDDSHPSTAGQQKATGEFVQVLNVFYNRWRSTGGTVTATRSATRTATGTATRTPTLSATRTATRTTTRTATRTVTRTPGSSPTVGHNRLYLPLLLKPGAGPRPTSTPTLRATSTRTRTPTRTLTVTPGASGALVQPADLVYRGAFRLPEGGDRPLTFEYGGNAMTFNPDGDPSGPADGYSGSLFISGHDRITDELPNGGQIAEVSIPVPLISRDVGALNRASFVQQFRNVLQGYFVGLDEIPRMGMQYLNHPATGPKIHLCWGQHIDAEVSPATHVWFSPDLSAPNVRGPWFIGNQSFYSVNDYMLEIPATWADQYAQGRYLGTGRFKDGGWSGMGPALIAYRPWIDASGNPAPAGTHLQETVLLLYESSFNTANIERCLNGYQHPDEWDGGAWITTPSGKTAVLMAGTKSNGTKYWYGYVNPAGPQYPCIASEMLGQFTVCRNADGSPCPDSDLIECADHNWVRGWWTTHWDAEFIFYDPATLARVAAGQLNSWEPQPYATMDIDNRLYLNPDGIDPEDLGVGDQRRHRLSQVAYDRAHGLLYVLERTADGAAPVVHVWQVQ